MAYMWLHTNHTGAPCGITTRLDIMCCLWCPSSSNMAAVTSVQMIVTPVGKQAPCSNHRAGVHRSRGSVNTWFILHSKYATIHYLGLMMSLFLQGTPKPLKTALKWHNRILTPSTCKMMSKQKCSEQLKEGSSSVMIWYFCYFCKWTFNVSAFRVVMSWQVRPRRLCNAWRKKGKLSWNCTIML